MLYVLSSFHQKKRDFFRCAKCAFYYVKPETQLTASEESERYQFHENDINDSGYQNYLSEVLSPLKEYFLENGREPLYHLDFGSGKSTTTEQILKKWKLTSETSYSYDLYFSPEKRPASMAVFDLVTAIEVVEHFRDPKASWKELLGFLRKGSYLFVGTQVFQKDLGEKAFSDWWYKNDPTHVSIYSCESLKHIAAEFGLELLKTDEKKYFLWRML